MLYYSIISEPKPPPATSLKVSMDKYHLQNQLPKMFADIFTTLPEAVIEIERRRKDPVLVQKVKEFLNHDIPEHFTYSKPIFYLSRHIATPNYETLRFVELTKGYDLPRVIGVDPKDKFFSGNPLKRALGKMPVTKGTARNGDDISEYFTIIDFTSNEGKKLDTILLKSGVSLVQFHEGLLREIYPNNVMIRDESAWVDRNGRGSLHSHYVYFLSLMIVGGVMFEFYESNEKDFIENTLIPALSIVTSRFGVSPLICNLVSNDIALEKNWNGYPSVIYQFVKNTID